MEADTKLHDEAEARDIISMSCVFVDGTQTSQMIIKQLRENGFSTKRGSEHTGQVFILYDAKAARHVSVS